MEQINAELAAGTLKTSDLAWIEGWKAWQPLSAVPGVRAPMQPPPLPRDLPTPPALSVDGRKKTSWYKAGWFHFLLFIFFPYLQLPLMWALKAFSHKTRVIVTIVGVVWLFCIVAANREKRSHFEDNLRAQSTEAPTATTSSKRSAANAESDTFSLGWLSPKVRVRNGNGEFSYTVPYTYDPKLAGWNIAQYVFEAANKRTDLTQVTVVCDLGIDDLVDKYGHKVERPYIMGNIVVKDLDEVRRYSDKDAYAHQAQYWYAEELSRMDYSEFMAKH